MREVLAPEVREIMPAELAEQAVVGYLAGKSPPVISPALGVPASRVYLALKERGVVRTRSEARRTAHARAAKGQDGAAGELPADWEAVVVERYAAGESGEAIAKDLGLGQGRVCKLLRERTLSPGSGVLRTLKEASVLRKARRRRAG